MTVAALPAIFAAASVPSALRTTIAHSELYEWEIPQNGEVTGNISVGSGAGRYIVIGLHLVSFNFHAPPASITVGSTTLNAITDNAGPTNSHMRLYGGVITEEGTQSLAISFGVGTTPGYPLNVFVHVEQAPNGVGLRATRRGGDTTGPYSYLGFAGNEGVLRGDRIVAFHGAQSTAFMDPTTSASGLGTTESGQRLNGAGATEETWTVNTFAGHQVATDSVSESRVQWSQDVVFYVHLAALYALDPEPTWALYDDVPLVRSEVYVARFNAAGDAVSFPFTVPTGLSNRLLTLDVMWDTSNGHSIGDTAVGFNGDAATAIAAEVTATSRKLRSWRLVAPDEGSNTITVDPSVGGGSSDVLVVARLWSGIDQSTPVADPSFGTLAADFGAPIQTTQSLTGTAGRPLVVVQGIRAPNAIEACLPVSHSGFTLGGQAKGAISAIAYGQLEGVASGTATVTWTNSFHNGGVVGHYSLVPAVSFTQLTATSVDDSVDAFGTTTVTPGAVSLTATAVDDSTDAFGTPITGNETNIQVADAPEIYTPPLGSSANFTVARAYEQPAGTEVNLNLGGGVPSTNAFGTPTVVALAGNNLTASSLDDSTDAFGIPTVSVGAVSLTASSLDDSTDAFGIPTVSVGAVSLTATAVDDSTDAFGTPTVSAGAVSLTATAVDDSTDAFGTPIVSQGSVFLVASAVDDSTDAFGTPSVTAGAVVLTASSLDDSTDLFGSPTAELAPITVYPEGVPSSSTVGSPTVTVGSVNLASSGVPSTSAIGSPVLSSGGVILQASGVSNASSIGAPTAAPGAVTVAATGLPGSSGIGSPSVTPGPVSVQAVAIADGDLFGSPLVALVQVLGSSGIPSGTFLGNPVISVGAVVLGPSGVASTGVAGTPTISTGPVDLVATGVGDLDALGAPRVVLIDRRIIPKRVALVPAENRVVETLAELREVSAERQSRTVLSPRTFD